MAGLAETTGCLAETAAEGTAEVSGLAGVAGGLAEAAGRFTAGLDDVTATAEACCI